MQLLLGRPSLSVGVKFDISLACFGLSEKPYSLQHCNLIASAADMHITLIISFAVSVDNSGTRHSVNFHNKHLLKVPILLSRRSLYNSGESSVNPLEKTSLHRFQHTKCKLALDFK